MGFDEYRPPSRINATPSPSLAGETLPDIKPAELKDRAVPFIFGAIFFAIGASLAWFLFLGPLFICEHAKVWPTAQAIIESSQISVHRGKSTSYHLEVVYRYSFTGQHRSTRYSPFGSSFPTYSAAKKLLDRYPVGSRVEVYVNPTEPEYAIINRSVSTADYFGLFPLLFGIVGGYSMYQAATAVYICRGKSSSGKSTVCFFNSIDGVKRFQEKQQKILLDLNEKQQKFKDLFKF